MANVTLCSDFTSTFFAFPRVTRNLHLLTGISVVFTLLSAFVAFTNATVVIAIIRSMFFGRHVNNKSKISMILIVSMAVSDCIVGVVPMPLSVYQVVNNGKWYLGQTTCSFRITADDFLCSVSIFHVMCMAVDRYLAVCHPLVYRRLTVITAYIMVSLSWLLPVFYFYGILHYGSDRYDSSCSEHYEFCELNYDILYRITSTIVIFYVPFPLLFILYFFVLREVRNFHKRKLNFGLKSLSSQHQYSARRKCQGYKYLPSCLNSCMSMLMIKIHKYEVQPKLKLCHVFEKTPDIICLSSVADFTSSPFVGLRPADTPLSLESREVAEPWDRSTILSAERLSSSELQIVKSCGYTTCMKRNQDYSEDLKESSQYAKDGINEIVDGISNITSDKHKSSSEGNETIDDKSRSSSDKRMTSFEVIPDLERLDYIHHRKVTIISKLSPSTKNSSETAIKTARPLNNTKAVRTIGIIVLAFTVCWFPFSVVSFLLGLFNHTFPYTVYIVTSWLGYLNSAINPCLYCSHKSVRRAIMDLICPSMK